jgi:hypothetical protein
MDDLDEHHEKAKEELKQEREHVDALRALIERIDDSHRRSNNREYKRHR